MPVCLAVAGALIAALPTQAFSLVWSHSVEKGEWREEWRIEGDRLRLAAAAVQGSGAGMEPQQDATLVDGAWRWAPEAPPIMRLVLANSAFAGDYRLCWDGTCRPLTAVLASGAGGAVEVYPCRTKGG
jgi:hypothetical protein